MIKKFYSHGKILLTGEYLVIYGANALALPLKLGQILEVSKINSPTIDWKTFEKGNLVFNAKFSLQSFDTIVTNDSAKSNYIKQLLTAINLLNKTIFNTNTGYSISTFIEFDMNWGLGSSSTLINNLAQWANINPFQLNRCVSKGSGYDIACAQAIGPIVYNIINDSPTVIPVQYNPPFIENLYLVYLNKKMATEQNITTVLNAYTIENKDIHYMNILTQKFLQASDIDTFMTIMDEHETFVSKIIDQKRAKYLHFDSFDGSIKSLGAWGGDFVLAASKQSRNKTIAYFNNNNYSTVIPLSELML